ncbi:MAG: GNAT family N-acetyltransferase [Pseudomonadota bacterium]
MTVPTLTTDRLTLRAHRIEDFPAYALLWASDEARFMGGPLNRDGAWGMFCTDVAGWSLHGFGAWAVERSVDGRTIGQVGLNAPPSFPERELGWLVYPDYRGRGYGCEAACAARGFAWRTLGWTTVVSYVDPQNAASIRLAKRLGAALDPDAARPEPSTLVFRHPSPEALR